MMFLHFIWTWVKTEYCRFMGFQVLVPTKIMEHRFAECQACEHNQDGTCEICHCLIHAKVMLAPESCPRKFWPAVWVKKYDDTLR